MPNIQRGEASFTTSEGVTYHLVMDFAAFVEATDAADMEVDELMAAISPQLDPSTGKLTKAPKIKHLAALLYGALTEKHPGITLRQAMNLFAEGSVVGEAIARALEGATPKPDPSAEGKARPRGGTGTARRKTGPRKA